jgi:LytS/YehU family sensor histidine kinase
MLTLEVRDDGRGLSNAGTNGAGVGISNARRRLERMYGPQAALDVSNAASVPGVVVRIRIPLNRSA